MRNMCGRLIKTLTQKRKFRRSTLVAAAAAAATCASSVSQAFGIILFDRRPRLVVRFTFLIPNPRSIFMRPICFLRTYSNTTAAAVAGHTTNSRRTRSARFLRNRLGVFPSPSRRTRFSRKHVVVKSVTACPGLGNLTVFYQTRCTRRV